MHERKMQCWAREQADAPWRYAHRFGGVIGERDVPTRVAHAREFGRERADFEAHRAPTSQFVASANSGDFFHLCRAEAAMSGMRGHGPHAPCAAQAGTNEPQHLGFAELRQAWSTLGDLQATVFAHRYTGRFSGDQNFAHPEEDLNTLRPPRCQRSRPRHGTCDPAAASSACTCASASPFHAPAPASPRADAAPPSLRGLRVLFLDGHVGPLNDMASTLIDDLGVLPQDISLLLFGQAYQFRNHIDKRLMTVREPPLRAMRGKPLESLKSFLVRSNDGAPRAWGGSFSAPACETRGPCMQALFDASVRREFALRFGEPLSQLIDVVACNFPTWQCALFEQVSATWIALDMAHAAVSVRGNLTGAKRDAACALHTPMGPPPAGAVRSHMDAPPPRRGMPHRSRPSHPRRATRSSTTRGRGPGAMSGDG